MKIYILTRYYEENAVENIHGTTDNDTIARTWDAAGGSVYETFVNGPSRDPLEAVTEDYFNSYIT